MKHLKLQSAVDILKKNIEGFKIVGYWEFPDCFVFSLDVEEYGSKLSFPGQYVVTNDGEVYPTNPMNHDISPETMKKY